MLPFLIGAAAGVVGAAAGVAGSIAVSAIKSMNEVFYTTKEASVLLNISEYTVRKKIREGDLKAEVIPGKAGYRIAKADLEDYLNGKSREKSVVPSESVASSDNASINTFGNSVKEIGKTVANNPDAIKNVDPELLQSIIEGRQKDLKGLQLRLQMLELDDDGSTEFKRKKLALEIAINDLEAELQAYKVSALTIKQLKEKAAVETAPTVKEEEAIEKDE